MISAGVCGVKVLNKNFLKQVLDFRVDGIEGCVDVYRRERVP